MTRAAAEAMGLKLFAPKGYEAAAATAILPPEGTDSGVIVKGLKSKFAAIVTDGQGEMKGHLFRIAHLGFFDYMDTIAIIGALEQVAVAAKLPLARLRVRQRPDRRSKGLRRPHEIAILHWLRLAHNSRSPFVQGQSCQTATMSKSASIWSKTKTAGLPQLARISGLSTWVKARYRIDNIPFYVLGISDGDLVSAVTEEDGRLVFSELVEASSNSTFRLIVSNEEETSVVRKMFLDLGCPSELVGHRFISLHIPESVTMKPIATLIEQGERDGRWEFEEGALRHSNSGFSYLPQ